MVAEYLTYRGFAVDTASNAEEAISKALTKTPTLILMDLRMPGVDGWEAIRRLKADARTCDVAIIAVSAHAMAPEQQRALEAGADSCVSKPFDVIALADAVAEFLQRGRAGLTAFDALTRVTRTRRQNVRT